MLMERIIGALTFRREVYAEVEKDEAFTQTAWLIVAVVAFLNQFGANASAGSLLKWLGGTIVGTILTIVGFALGAAVISWVGRTLFNAEVTFDELVRTMSLAYVWTAVAVVGIVTIIAPVVLGCLLTPVIVIASLLGLAATLIAVKEALDLDWGPTIITVIVGWVVQLVIVAVGGLIKSLFGLAGAGATGLFR